MSTTNQRFPPGARYLLTRRYAQGRALRRPAAEVNLVLRACIGEVAERSGVEVLALKTFSPHCQIIAIDRRGRFPLFMKSLDEHLRCLDQAGGGSEAFWAPGSYCLVQMAGDDCA